VGSTLIVPWKTHRTCLPWMTIKFITGYTSRSWWPHHQRSNRRQTSTTISRRGLLDAMSNFDLDDLEVRQRLG